MKGKYQHTRAWHRWMVYPFLFLLLASPVACSNDAPPVGNTVVGRDSLPVMVTRGVSKIITDSGIVRYKIITEEWRIYDKTTPPRWEFPKGLFLERYDNKFKVDLRFTVHGFTTKTCGSCVGTCCSTIKPRKANCARKSCIGTCVRAKCRRTYTPTSNNPNKRLRVTGLEPQCKTDMPPNTTLSNQADLCQWAI